jgi:hypothetical protein
MKQARLLIFLFLLAFSAVSLLAQVPVRPSPDQKKMLAASDPKLAANK